MTERTLGIISTVNICTVNGENEMINEILQKYIPSKTYVAYLNEIGYTFTDFETAAILYHAIPYVQQRFDELSRLAEQTDDEILKMQIEEKLKREKEKINRFTTSGKNAIFVVEYFDEEHGEYEVAGYGASLEAAWEIGMKLESKFSIRKYALHIEFSDDEDYDPILYISLYGSNYFNPYMGKPKNWEITEDNIQEVMGENKVDPIIKVSTPYNKSFGTFDYDNKGRLIYYWVNEDKPVNLSDETLEEKAKSSMEDSYSDKLFYNAFVPMPFPLELGDYVRCVDGFEGEIGRNDDRLIGIVSVSREDYENFLERAKRIYVDFSDAQVTTTFIKKDGGLTHNHIPPIFLEKAEIDEEADWFNLARQSRWMIMGEGDLDFFTYAYDDYKEKAKQKNAEA